MSTLADALTSSTGRKLNLRKRPDLIATRHKYQGRSYWNVKDPVGLHYFRFQDEEYFILNLLDGEASLEDIKEEFEAEFPPQKIKFEEIGQFLGMLHKSGLVLSDAPNQGSELLKRFTKRRNQEWVQKAANILSLRFRGINPEHLLRWLDKYLWWIYDRRVVACTLLFNLTALLLVAVNFHEFRLKLPEFHQFFTPANAFWLAVVLGVTKIIHEFGHGLTCKHFGGDCHEMGMMLLVLTPALYCNVSDSWMLPNKWHRTFIGLGGMYVELFMASVCTWIWWYTQPGLLHNLCLSTMFICSVSTVVFNGNPLLRYDGYYILADILEIPNMGQKSNAVLSRFMGWLCFGFEMQDDPFLPRQNRFLFGLYAVSSFAYRWLVVLSILLFMNAAFKPYRLEVVGRFLGMMSLWGMFGIPLWKLTKFFWTPGRTDMVKKSHLYPSLAVVAAVILAFVYVPLPHRVHATFELVPYEAKPVFVEVPGVLDQVYLKPGQKVKMGDPIASLKNIDVDMELLTLQSKLDELKVRETSLRSLATNNDRDAESRLGEVRKSLEMTEQMILTKRKDTEHLILRAPVAGTILPPPEIPNRKPRDGELPAWSGTPFTPRNIGALMSESTLFCKIGDPAQMEAQIVVDQADIALIKLKQKVEIQLDQLPARLWTGEVQEIANTPLKVSPTPLSNRAGGELATKQDESGVERPLAPSYQVRVFPLDDPDQLLRIGLRGRARIHVPWESAWGRVWRWFQQTFHFKM